MLSLPGLRLIDTLNQHQHIQDDSHLCCMERRLSEVSIADDSRAGSTMLLRLLVVITLRARKPQLNNQDVPHAAPSAQPRREKCRDD